MVLSDEETSLVKASQKGDHEAFAMLIQRHQKMIHGVTFRMTGSLSDAEDLSQETFLQAYQHLSKFRGESKFSSWLCQVAINRCLNWRKQAARRQELHKGWEPEENASTETNETSQRVQNALLQLNPKQRAAIVLTVYDGLSHAEAAKVLGCSETTVSWRIFMARSRLKQLLRNLTEKESQ